MAFEREEKALKLNGILTLMCFVTLAGCATVNQQAIQFNSEIIGNPDEIKANAEAICQAWPCQVAYLKALGLAPLVPDPLLVEKVASACIATGLATPEAMKDDQEVCAIPGYYDYALIQQMMKLAIWGMGTFGGGGALPFPLPFLPPQQRTMTFK